jgi:CDP-4-dehydro-6-deoxyglucose reductase
MDQLIDVNRAARLAGVTRVEIQRQIASGLLPTFEGRVKMSDLVGLYPEIDESRSYMLEVVSQIKEDAVGKAVRRRDGSMPQDLAGLRHEIVNLRREASFYKEKCDKYKQLLTDLKPKLVDLEQTSNQKGRFAALIAWLTHKTEEFW